MRNPITDIAFPTPLKFIEVMDKIITEIVNETNVYSWQSIDPGRLDS